MGYATDVKFKVTPDEDQPPDEIDPKMVEMVHDAAGGSDWMWLPKWYHGPGWIEVDDVTVEEVDRLAEIHGDPACPSVATISEARFYYLKSCGDEFVKMMKYHFGHGPDYDVEWTHDWEAEIITDEDRKKLRELLDYFDPGLAHKYYIPMGFVGKITIDAERR